MTMNESGGLAHQEYISYTLHPHQQPPMSYGQSQQQYGVMHHTELLQQAAAANGLIATSETPEGQLMMPNGVLLTLNGQTGGGGNAGGGAGQYTLGSPMNPLNPLIIPNNNGTNGMLSPSQSTPPSQRSNNTVNSNTSNSSAGNHHGGSMSKKKRKWNDCACRLM